MMSAHLEGDAATAVCLVLQGPYDSDPRVRRKAEALVAAGYSVDVLALRTPGGEKEYALGGVNVRTMPLGKRRGSRLRYLFEYGMFFAWVFARVHLDMRRRRYAVVDVNTLPDFLVFAPLFVRRMGARLVLDMHEITPEFYISKYGSGANARVVRLLKFLERISFKFADRVITINEPVEDLLVARGLSRQKSTVMMNSADEARFASVGQPQPTGDQVPGDPRFVMIYHGTLTKLYGLDIAIDAFSRVHLDMPGAELRILGSGPEADPLRDLVRRFGLEEKVRLVGQVPSSDIPGWLSASDVGLLPIRRDALLDFAFPNKLPEYIIHGKPVIISRLKAIEHYFSDDALAYARPNDAADLSRQMLRVFHDPELRARLAVRAREEYEPIRWTVMKERYLSLVEAMADPSAAPAGVARRPSQRSAAL